MDSPVGNICPHCHVPFKEGDAVALCDTCNKLQHLRCWQQNARCTTPGCAGRIREILNAPQSDHPTQPTVVGNPTPEVLYETTEGSLQIGLPLILEQAVLLQNPTNQQVSVRCTFRSTDDRVIKAVLVSIACYDVWKHALGEPVEHSYMDLRAARNEEFGQTVTVPLPDANIRYVEVTVKKVMLADGTMPEGTGETAPFPSPILLKEHLGSDALAQEYARETTPKAQFVVQEANGYRRCTCGTVQPTDQTVCPVCGCEALLLQQKLDPQALAAEKETYDRAVKEERDRQEAERAQRIREAEEQVRADQERMEEERRAAEAEQKKAAKKKKTVVIAVVAVLAAIAVTCTTIFFGIPYMKYRDACAALEAGKFGQATQLFTELDGFLDSEVMLDEVTYCKALDYLERALYDKAALEFKKIPDYKDSRDQLDEVHYRKACDKLKKGNYSTAIALFEELGNYEDSDKKLLEAKYGYVKDQYNNDDQNTYNYLVELISKSYKDAASLFNSLYKWKVTVTSVNTGKDSSVDMTRISKYDPVYFHLRLTGGIPNDSTVIHVKAYLPNGSSHEYEFDNAWENGSSGWYGWENGIYTLPQYGTAGTLKLYFYDDDGNQIGSGSVTITD